MKQPQDMSAKPLAMRLWTLRLEIPLDLSTIPTPKECRVSTVQPDLHKRMMITLPTYPLNGAESPMRQAYMSYMNE